MKRRVHTVLVDLTFNRPCTAAFAVREARASIWGLEYTSPRNDSDPTTFQTRRWRPLTERGAQAAIEKGKRK